MHVETLGELIGNLAARYASLDHVGLFLVGSIVDAVEGFPVEPGDIDLVHIVRDHEHVTIERIRALGEGVLPAQDFRHSPVLTGVATLHQLVYTEAEYTRITPLAKFDRARRYVLLKGKTPGEVADHPKIARDELLLSPFGLKDCHRMVADLEVEAAATRTDPNTRFLRVHGEAAQAQLIRYAVTHSIRNYIRYRTGMARPRSVEIREVKVLHPDLADAIDQSLDQTVSASWARPGALEIVQTLMESAEVITNV